MWGLSSSERIMNKNGHGFSACQKTGLKESGSRRHGLCHCLHLMLITGIWMDADADHGRHVRIMLLRVHEHAVQAVIIKDTVVDAFRGCALFIDLPIGHLCHGGHLYKAGYPNRAGS